MELQTENGKKKAPMTTGKKWALLICMAVVFGIIAGGVMVGMNYLGGRMASEEESIPQTSTVKVTAQAEDSDAVVAVAREAMPSVVTISTMSVEEMRSFFGGTQEIQVQGAGTGVIVNKNESELLIATNNHVVEGATQLSVGFVDQSSVEAQVKGTDVDNDLAVVAVQLSDIPAETLSQLKIATIGDSDELELGQPVVAIGNALGYAYTTVKKVHILLNEYFRYLTEESFIRKNPMQSVPMMKKANFLAAQDKECVLEQETVTVFTPTEIAKFKREAFATFTNGKRKYQQAAAYILMLNTGLRTGELLGLLNSDIDLQNRVLHLERGVKEVWRRDGLQAEPGRDVKVGKLKSATSKRTVPLNDTAIAMIQDLRKEACFGEETPLVPDEHGDYTRPVNFRKRYYRILAAAGIDKKGLHSLRHTFASSLVNGIKQEDGTIKSLTPRQVADLLGHSTSQITELYYVKKDTSRLSGITNDFNL